MSGTTGLVFHDVYRGRGVSPMKLSWNRYSLAYELFDQLGLFAGGLLVLTPSAATDAELELVHTPEYIRRVRAADEAGSGLLGPDTPAWRGIFERAAVPVGGTLLAARRIAAGELTHAFNPAGGLHHAHRERASGFCVFNDIVIAARVLQREFGMQRIAVIDIDGHHGDGTQALLYDEPVLTVSLHQFDGRFYPGTGRVDEIGTGAGRGYSVNVPLPRRAGDRSYLAAFEALLPPLLYAYEPQFILVQFGVDAHYSDPLVGLSLSTAAYAHMIGRLHDLAHQLCDGRLIFLGGGGYNPHTVARCWAILLAQLLQAQELGVFKIPTDLFDATAPAEEAHVAHQVALAVADAQALVFPHHAIPLPM